MSDVVAAATEIPAVLVVLVVADQLAPGAAGPSDPVQLAEQCGPQRVFVGAFHRVIVLLHTPAQVAAVQGDGGFAADGPAVGAGGAFRTDGTVEVGGHDGAEASGGGVPGAAQDILQVLELALADPRRSPPPFRITPYTGGGHGVTDDEGQRVRLRHLGLAELHRDELGGDPQSVPVRVQSRVELIAQWLHSHRWQHDRSGFPGVVRHVMTFQAVRLSLTTEICTGDEASSTDLPVLSWVVGVQAISASVSTSAANRTRPRRMSLSRCRWTTAMISAVVSSPLLRTVQVSAARA